MGKNKYIESPEKMWEYFLAYKKWAKENPITIEDYVGKDAVRVLREKPRPLTIEGFENWCFEKEIINDLSNYFANSNDAYSNYSTICRTIRKVIRQDQIEGGIAGIYNRSITQTLNNLADTTNVNANVSTPIFGENPLDDKGNE